MNKEGEAEIQKRQLTMHMMPLLEHAPATRSIVPASHLQVMLNTYQQDWLTGIVQIAWASANERLFLLLASGTITNAYLVTGETSTPISPSDLKSRISAETLIVHTLALPPEGLHTVKSLLEWHPPVESLNIEPHDLEGQLNAWSVQGIAGVAHIAWPDAEGFVLLSGENPPNHAVYTTEKHVETGTAGLYAIYAHAVSPCTLTRYAAPADYVTKRQDLALLQRTFGSLISAVLQRYTELVGRYMTQMLILELNTHAHASGWKVSITDTGIADAHASEEPEVIAQAYRSLLADLIERMAVVIGKRLAGVLVMEASIPLGSAAQQVIQTYSLIPTTTIRRDLYGRSI